MFSASFEIEAFEKIAIFYGITNCGKVHPI